MTDPSTDDDWTIHALNIHGAFFERWCRHVIAKTPRWRVKHTNKPVGWEHRHESSLDVRADLTVDHHLVSLLIECKKHNPDFIDWIFLPKPSTDPAYPLTISQLRWAQRGTQWNVVTKNAALPWTSQIADEARETRGDYLKHKGGNKTKTANSSISETAMQVAVATKWIAHEEERNGNALGTMVPTPTPAHRYHHIIPVIVTTAQLHLCRFDPSDINPATGELPWDKAELTSVPHLRFEYPMPLSIQGYPPLEEIAPTVMDGRIDRLQRLQIVVVNSMALQGFLNDFDLEPNHAYHLM